MTLKYKNLGLSELGLGQEVLAWVLGDDDIVSAVESFHNRDKRCAVVVWLSGDEVDDAYISDEVALKDEFKLKKVRETVAQYDPRNNVCVVIVRDGKAAVLIGDLD